MAERNAAPPSDSCHTSSSDSLRELTLADDPNRSRVYQTAGVQARRRTSKNKARANQVVQLTPSPQDEGHKEQPRHVRPRTSAPQSASESVGTRGFSPRLDRINEGSECDQEKRNRKSESSLKERGERTRRVRSGVGSAVPSRKTARLRQSSLQQHNASTLFNLVNPSSISVLSILTSNSNSSSGSGSTLTQKSYNRALESRRKATSELKKDSPSENRKPKRKAAMEPVIDPNSVFQYLVESPTTLQPSYYARRSSATSTTSVDSEAAPPPLTIPVRNQPRGKPAPRKDSMLDDCDILQERFSSDSGITLHSSPEPNGPAMSATSGSPLPAGLAARTDGHDDGHQSSDEEDDDSESESEQGENEGSGRANSPISYAIEKLRLNQSYSKPSVAEVKNDEWYRRMQEQETEARQHVLESPQPKRDFRFLGSPSPNPAPGMPLFDRQAPFPYPQTYPPALAVPQPPTAPPSVPMPPAPPYSQAQPPYFSQPLSQQVNTDASQKTITGYELVANKLSDRADGDSEGEAHIKPVYRKFEHLNHRILLHLQDEISELEEELRQLDESVAQLSRVGADQQILPASRRAERRYGSEIHLRRTDLLGRIFIKLNQYNQALTSYKNMTRSVGEARPADVRVYRDWLEKQAPVDKAERQFLDHQGDLMSLEYSSQDSQKHKAPAPPLLPGLGQMHVQHIAVGLPIVLLLPLIGYSMIPGLLGRLFVLAIIGSAEAAIIMLTEVASFISSEEWTTCGSVYFAVLAVLAVIMR